MINEAKLESIRAEVQAERAYEAARSCRSCGSPDRRVRCVLTSTDGEPFECEDGYHETRVDRYHLGDRSHHAADRCRVVTEDEVPFVECSVCRDEHPSDERHPCE